MRQTPETSWKNKALYSSTILIAISSLVLLRPEEETEPPNNIHVHIQRTRHQLNRIASNRPQHLSLSEKSEAPVESAPETSRSSPEKKVVHDFQEDLQFIEQAFKEDMNSFELYMLINDTLKRLNTSQAQQYIRKIVELTDRSNELPAEATIEDYEQRRYLVSRYAECMVETLENPVLTGFLLDALEQSERKTLDEYTKRFGPPDENAPQMYHQLRGAMHQYLTMYLERNTMDFRPASPHPDQILQQLRLYLERAKKLGLLEQGQMNRYEQRIRNVS